MNPLSRLMGKPAADTDEVSFDDLSPEEQEEILANEKKARIQYHRDHVRNGPQSYRTITVGQQRRAAERSKKALQRKANKRHRRSWFAKQRDFATLRGHLTVIGALPPAVEGFRAPTTQRILSGQWLVRAFGERDEEGQLVLSDDLLQNAVKAGLEALKTGARG